MCVNNKKNCLYQWGSLFIVLGCMQYLQAEKQVSSHNGLVKKRVIQRQAQKKVDSVLAQVKNQKMQELADSFQGVGKLYELLKVSSMDEALKIVATMQDDIKNLLSALEVDSVSEGVTQAKQVRLVMQQLSEIQTKIGPS